MSRYIDVEKFVVEMRERVCKDCEDEMACWACGLHKAIGAVDDYPAADVAPVVHGHWENIENAKNTIKCSNCGHIRELRHFSEIIKRPKLCEMCGTTMDESEDNENG